MSDMCPFSLFVLWRGSRGSRGSQCPGPLVRTEQCAHIIVVMSLECQSSMRSLLSLTLSLTLALSLPPSFLPNSPPTALSDSALYRPPALLTVLFHTNTRAPHPSNPSNPSTACPRPTTRRHTYNHITSSYLLSSRPVSLLGTSRSTIGNNNTKYRVSRDTTRLEQNSVECLLHETRYM